MKIVMMTGSAHRNGTTATLADRFQQNPEQVYTKLMGALFDAE